SQEQIAVRKKVVVEVLNDSPLRGQIKIDEHIAAEDDVHALHERHPRIVGQVQAAEAHVPLHHRLHSQLLALGREIFLPVIGAQIAGAVAPVQTVLGVRQGALVQVGSQNLKCPISQAAL